MKTHIIQLETHDDIISTRDKMNWSKAPRILLLWPRRGSLLRRAVDMALIQRRARELGAQVALVTRDAVVKTNAREAGIPVYSSAKVAQRQEWGPSEGVLSLQHPEGWQPADPAELRAEQARLHSTVPGSLDQTGPRLLFFSLGVVAVLALALFFYPSATVTFSPAQAPQAIVMPVWASPAVSAPSVAGGIPAHTFTLIEEGEQYLDSTGSVTVPDQFAIGAVLFSNLTDKPVDLPAGTVVRTLGDTPQRFVTSEDSQVPAGPGQTAEVAIRALAPGQSGNIGADQIAAIEGEAGLNLSVSNPLALSGGSEQSNPSPSEQDYIRLRQELIKTMGQTAMKDLTGRMTAGQQAIPASILLSRVIEEVRDPEVGQPADRLHLAMRVEFKALYVLSSEVEQAAQAGLDANLPAGFRALAGTLSVHDLTQPKMDGTDAARWQVRAQRSLQAGWSQDQLLGSLRGHTLPEAAQMLKTSIPLSQEPQISIRPSWWGRMPYLTFRIQVSAQ